MARLHDLPDDAETLDEMPLDVDISGSEGLSVNDLSRIRVLVLLGQNQTLVAQTQFADAKAAALMTLMGLLALRGPVDLTAVGTGDPLALGFVIVNALSIAGCIVAIIPRYPPPAVRHQLALTDRFSWPALVSPGYDAEDHAAFMRVSEASELVVSLARSNAAVSRILLRKFQALRAAFLLALSNVALIALALGAG
jgi:hypothetical protein